MLKVFLNLIIHVKYIECSNTVFANPWAVDRYWSLGTGPQRRTCITYIN